MSIGHFFNKVETGRLGNWILAELKREKIFRNCSRQFLIPNITPGDATPEYKVTKVDTLNAMGSGQTPTIETKFDSSSINMD